MRLREHEGSTSSSSRGKHIPVDDHTDFMGHRVSLILNELDAKVAVFSRDASASTAIFDRLVFLYLLVKRVGDVTN